MTSSREREAYIRGYGEGWANHRMGFDKCPERFAPPLPVDGESGEVFRAQVLGAFVQPDEPSCPVMDCCAPAKLRMADPDDTWFECEAGHQFGPTRTVWTQPDCQPLDAALSTSPAHTVERIKEMRRTAGLGVAGDPGGMPPGTVYCDVCFGLGIAAGEGRGCCGTHIDDCPGTFKAPEPEPEPCETCGGGGRHFAWSKNERLDGVGYAWNDGQHHPKCWIGKCPDCCGEKSE